MKSISIYLIAILSFLLLYACSNNDDNSNDFKIPSLTKDNSVLLEVEIDKDNEPNTSISKDLFEVMFIVSGDKVAVDWGDGSISRYNSLPGKSVLLHKYTDEGIYIIKIWGEGLTSLHISNWADAGIGKDLSIGYCPNLEWLSLTDFVDMKTLNLSKCPGLKKMECQRNTLEELKVGQNSDLRYLDCSQNALTAEALNEIFTELPSINDAKVLPIVKLPIIEFYDNSGADTCDKDIIIGKGWKINEREVKPVDRTKI